MSLQHITARWRNITESNLTLLKASTCCTLITIFTATYAVMEKKHRTFFFISIFCKYSEARFMFLYASSLGISVMPLSSDRVLFEQGRDPFLALGLPFTSRFSLSFFQDELVIGRLRLVLVVDGPGHMLP